MSDGKLTTVKTSSVVVASTSRSAANAGDDQVVVVDTRGALRCFRLTSDRRHRTYHWAFGDGTSADGPAIDHTYPTAGTYTTTPHRHRRRADRHRHSRHHRASRPRNCLVCWSRSATAQQPLGGADVIVIDGDGQKFSATTDDAGRAHLQGLPDGTYTSLRLEAGLPAGHREGHRRQRMLALPA